MGVILTRREYYNEFRSETTSWLLGNVGDKITLQLDFEVSILFISSNSLACTVSGVNQFSIDSGNFMEYGFTSGSVIAWLAVAGSTPVSGTGTVTLLTPTIMRITVLSGSLTNGTYPFNDGTTVNTILQIFSVEPVEAFNFNYNLLSNDDVGSGSVSSLIDGTTLDLKATGINPSSGTPVTMIPSSIKSGFNILSANIRGLGISGVYQKFRVDVDFIISPLFESSSNFINNLAPPYLFSSSSLTDTFKSSFMPELANPNSTIKNDASSVALLGNVGWFDENYNGVSTGYSVQSIEYRDSSSTLLTSLMFNADTDFEIKINQSTASSSTKYKIGISWIPEDYTSISNNTKYNYENLMYNSFGGIKTTSSAGASISGYANLTGAKIDVDFDSIGIAGSVVTIKGKIKPNLAFANYITTLASSDRNFVIWVSVANQGLVTNASDRVSLIADFNQFIEAVIPAEVGDATVEFLNHAQPINNTASATYDGAVEDEINIKTRAFLDTALNEKLENVSVIIEGYNTSTGFTFPVETFVINCVPYPTDPSGVQLVNFNALRGFQMATGVDKNKISFVRNPSFDTGTKVCYDLIYSFRNRWEDWVLNSVVPSDFIQAGQKNNGQNQDWARLDSYVSTWKLRASYEMRMLRGTTDVRTKNNGLIDVVTWDESSVWTASITHYDEARVNNLFLGLSASGIRENAIISDNKTLVEADFDLIDTTADVGAIHDYYGVIRIEKYEQGGINQIEMLSSVLDNTNGILKPVVGETHCKIEKISATKIRLSGLIDDTFLDSGVSYKTSARIGYKNTNIEGIYGTSYDVPYA